MDLAVELGRVGKKCFLSTRRGAWVGKRVGPGGFPGWPAETSPIHKLSFPIKEDYATTRFKCCFWDRVVPEKMRNWLLCNQLQHRFDHHKYGMLPKHSYFRFIACNQPTLQFSFLSQHLTISDDLPTRIITGSVQVKPDIREFTANGIVWADGSRTDGVDNVVMATGYLFDFSLLERGTVIPVQDNQTRLYKNMLPPSLAQWNSLAVIGLVQPSGSILPAAEIQVFWEVATFFSSNSRHAFSLLL